MSSLVVLGPACVYTGKFLDQAQNTEAECSSQGQYLPRCWIVESTIGCGIVGQVTDHDYLDLTFFCGIRLVVSVCFLSANTPGIVGTENRPYTRSTPVVDSE